MREHNAILRVPARAAAFEAALEGLTSVNERLMTDPSLGGPSIPPLYESGVRYKNEPRDVWRHAVDVAAEGWGDCEDLSAYRCAELRVSGEDPDCYVTTYESGPGRYHAVVVRGDRSIEDPSRELGMGQRQPRGRGMKRRATANVVGADPTPEKGREITFEILKVPGGGWGGAAGYRGFVRLPLGTTADGTPQALLTVGPQTAKPEQAAAAALTSSFSSLVNNPAVKSALQAIPGGAAAAALLTNSEAKKAITSAASAAASAVKKLKFW